MCYTRNSYVKREPAICLFSVAVECLKGAFVLPEKQAGSRGFECFDALSHNSKGHEKSLNKRNGSGNVS